MNKGAVNMVEQVLCGRKKHPLGITIVIYIVVVKVYIPSSNEDCFPGFISLPA
uniref:Uncharacterized protein n=1 Tax=Trichinella nativa TaxID=6335 RepID=A0A0V1KIS8_9BILA